LSEPVTEFRISPNEYPVIRGLQEAFRLFMPDFQKPFRNSRNSIQRVQRPRVPDYLPADI
jgi:hypothetical protein